MGLEATASVRITDLRNGSGTNPPKGREPCRTRRSVTVASWSRPGGGALNRSAKPEFGHRIHHVKTTAAKGAEWPVARRAAERSSLATRQL
jgi:hypothetical protein